MKSGTREVDSCITEYVPNILYRKNIQLQVFNTINLLDNTLFSMAKFRPDIANCCAQNESGPNRSMQYVGIPSRKKLPKVFPKTH